MQAFRMSHEGGPPGKENEDAECEGDRDHNPITKEETALPNRLFASKANV